MLNDFGKDERPWVEDLCRASADLLPLLLKGEDSAFVSKVHLALEARGHKQVKRLGEG